MSLTNSLGSLESPKNDWCELKVFHIFIRSDQALKIDSDTMSIIEDVENNPKILYEMRQLNIPNISKNVIQVTMEKIPSSKYKYLVHFKLNLANLQVLNSLPTINLIAAHLSNNQHFYNKIQSAYDETEISRMHDMETNIEKYAILHHAQVQHLQNSVYFDTKVQKFTTMCTSQQVIPKGAIILGNQRLQIAKLHKHSSCVFQNEPTKNWKTVIICPAEVVYEWNMHFQNKCTMILDKRSFDRYVNNNANTKKIKKEIDAILICKDFLFNYPEKADLCFLGNFEYRLVFDHSFFMSPERFKRHVQNGRQKFMWIISPNAVKIPNFVFKSLFGLGNCRFLPFDPSFNKLMFDSQTANKSKKPVFSNYWVDYAKKELDLLPTSHYYLLKELPIHLQQHLTFPMMRQHLSQLGNKKTKSQIQNVLRRFQKKKRQHLQSHILEITNWLYWTESQIGCWIDKNGATKLNSFDARLDTDINYPEYVQMCQKYAEYLTMNKTKQHEIAKIGNKNKYYKKLLQVIKGQENFGNCAICLETITKSDVGITPCGHFFCYTCLCKLLENQNYNEYNDAQCPHRCTTLSWQNINRLKLENNDAHADIKVFNTNSTLDTFGSKLTVLLQIIASEPKKSKFIVWCGTMEIVAIVQEMLEEFGLKGCLCKGNAIQKKKKISDFHQNDNCVAFLMCMDHVPDVSLDLSNVSKIIILLPPIKRAQKIEDMMMQLVRNANPEIIRILHNAPALPTKNNKNFNIDDRIWRKVSYYKNHTTKGKTIEF